MAKAPDAFRTISEVSESLDTPTHVLRFWESKFTQVKPVKRAGGRRYYRPEDLALLGGIKVLLHDHGMTIKGAQKVLREQGIKAVAALSQAALPETGETIDNATAEPQATLDLPIPVADKTEHTAPVTVEVQPTAEQAPSDTGESRSAFAAADPKPDNVVPMPGGQRSMPTPRPVPPARILALLGTCSVATIAQNAAAIVPLRDRLAALHAQMTKH